MVPILWVNVRLTPWALYPFLVGVLSAAVAIRKLGLTDSPSRSAETRTRTALRAALGTYKKHKNSGYIFKERKSNKTGYIYRPRGEASD